MLEQKNKNDTSNNLNSDNTIKAKSSKSSSDQKTFNLQENLQPIYEYECENCKKIFYKNNGFCSECGSKYIKKIDTGKKYCYVNLNKRKSKGLLDFNSDVSHPFVDSPGLFFLMLFGVPMLLLGILLHFNLDVDILPDIIAILSVIIIFPLFFIEKKRPTKDLKIERPKYLYIKGLNYSIRRTSSDEIPYYIKIKDRVNDEKEMEIESKDEKYLIHRPEKVELLINCNDKEDYEIDFDLEKTIRRRYKW